MSSISSPKIPTPVNEPIKDYAPGSPERAAARAALAQMLREPAPVIPCVVDGKFITEGTPVLQRMPHDHKHALCQYHQASTGLIQTAIDGALRVREAWADMAFTDRACIFLKAADLLATKYRYQALAAVMLGQGKSAWEAEIDVAELIDFWRFNVKYAERIYAQQPLYSSPGTWNRVEWRPLEGFVLAVTPFNFIAITMNLASSPAIMGNVVLIKPSSMCIRAAWLIYNVLVESGLPPGVIQFIPGRGSQVGPTVLAHPQFVGLHFTGSTATFEHLWLKTARSLATYRTYPRLVGETGGKNFHIIHKSADLPHAVAETVRSAFGYSGQKCSACSRLYVAASVWPAFRARLLAAVEQMTTGPTTEFEHFMSAVIDEAAFDRIAQYIDEARAAEDVQVLCGGTYDKRVGWFVQPTILYTENLEFRAFREEIFGPVLSVTSFPDADWDAWLARVDSGSEYALTGSIFAQDRTVVAAATRQLRDSAGNFYVNTKSTGAVVGQQPFGGARKSGTNDKAGSPANLLRWVSPRTIKEQFLPVSSYVFPHQLPDLPAAGAEDRAGA